MLSDWPVERPSELGGLVNQPMTEKEAEAIQICIARNRPYGNEPWQSEQARRWVCRTPSPRRPPQGNRSQQRGKN